VNALSPLGTPHALLPEVLSRARVPVGAVELRELRYFAAAARNGNLGRAARELNVTPPAISQQLHKLEDALGTQLLIRHGRGVTPTPAGASLLQRIDTVLHLLDAPLDPDPAAADIAGTVSVAVPVEIAALLAAPLVEQVRHDWPGVTLDLQETVGGGAETRLLGCQVDIALLQDPPDLDELRTERLLTEGLGLVMSPRAALAGSALPLRLRDLAGVTLILPNPRHWIRRLLARAGFQRGLRLDAALQVDSVAMTREMVRNGLGCTILPAVAVRDEIARGALVFRPIEQPALTITHAIAVRRMAAPVVREVARTMGDVIRSLAASGTWPGAQLVRSPATPTREEPGQAAPPEVWRPARLEPSRGNLEFVEGD
jgi:LysR family transcriptional regulator, nitrogen assimilation regulatory protein